MYTGALASRHGWAATGVGDPLTGSCGGVAAWQDDHSVPKLWARGGYLRRRDSREAGLADRSGACDNRRRMARETGAVSR